MNSVLSIDRFQFAFTVTFHYLFPQLTMGLALLILVLKTIARFAAEPWGFVFPAIAIVGLPRDPLE